jgi:hypothetical protein
MVEHLQSADDVPPDRLNTASDPMQRALGLPPLSRPFFHLDKG